MASEAIMSTLSILFLVQQFINQAWVSHQQTEDQLLQFIFPPSLFTLQIVFKAPLQTTSSRLVEMEFAFTNIVWSVNKEYVNVWNRNLRVLYTNNKKNFVTRHDKRVCLFPFYLMSKWIKVYYVD